MSHSRYRILLAGRFSDRFASSLDGVTVDRVGDHTALLTTPRDLAHLERLLERLRNLGIEPISVEVASDPDLAAALRRGDEAAFLHVSGELTPGLRSLAGLHVDGEDAVDTVVDDAWRRALDRLDGPDAAGSLGALVFGALLERLRTASPAQPVRGRATASDDATVVALRRAVRQLPPAERAVVALRDVLGRPAAEVCETLAISPERMCERLHAGRPRVHAALDGRLVAHAA
jgi:DNA-directed RNA polymerase specialized sigma24 family protein